MSLTLESVIGYSGSIPKSLRLDVDNENILYTLGSTIVVKNLLENKQYFLECGSSKTTVSCMALSKDGKLLATGQKTHQGFAASVWIWNLSERKVIHKLNLYKSCINDVSFSANNKYIATLGGIDDNKLIIWDVETGNAICGCPASNDTAVCVSFSNTNDYVLVTGGKYNFRIWEFDLKNRKIRPTDCKLGSLKRIINCMVISEDDEIVYAGTQSGDLLQISMQHKLFQVKGPTKSKPFAQGIQSVILTKHNSLIVGCGDGTIAELDKNTLAVNKELKVDGSVNSLELNNLNDHFFVGTNKSSIYLVALNDFDYELRLSCHNTAINCVCYPINYSKLFVTAGENDIRVWNANNQRELLRINVKNVICNCVALSSDGKSILSGWNDGKIRVFYPESGKLKYIIHDAHSNGVTCVALSSDGKRLVSGGNDSLVRIWLIEPNMHKMLASLREHQNAVSYVAISSNNNEFVSASHDGSCVVWDLQKCLRKNALFSTTQFSHILYHPDQSQLLTTGTDRQISYWDTNELQQIRVLDGSDNAAINCLDINNNGTLFVSAGEDRLVKLWDYDNGILKSNGKAHSGSITSVAISPDSQKIVSVGKEGAIMIWNISSQQE